MIKYLLIILICIAIICYGVNAEGIGDIYLQGVLHGICGAIGIYSSFKIIQ